MCSFKTSYENLDFERIVRENPGADFLDITVDHVDREKDQSLSMSNPHGCFLGVLGRDAHFYLATPRGKRRLEKAGMGLRARPGTFATREVLLLFTPGGNNAITKVALFAEFYNELKRREEQVTVHVTTIN